MIVFARVSSGSKHESRKVDELFSFGNIDRRRNNVWAIADRTYLSTHRRAVSIVSSRVNNARFNPW